MERKSGILMHITSLPGRYGIGSFGKEAFHFIDCLKSGGFSVWQTLPFGMPDGFGSPYSSFSAFSGNPYLLDLDVLLEKGYLTEEEISREIQSAPWQCEFERLRVSRIPLLKTAAKRALCDPSVRQAVAEFSGSHPEVAQFCRFMAQKERNGDLPWIEWRTSEYDEDDEAAWQFIQYEFCREWDDVRTYAHENGIQLVGDIPIYVAYDSSDVYCNRENGIFDLDESGRRKNVAGVPPDFFSEDGQLWGNPLYNWAKMKEDDYAWWRARLRHLLSQFDGVRIDHFRGLASFWSVPADARTAREGRWEQGPREDFIRVIRETVQEAAQGDSSPFIIAEDLGIVTKDVTELLAYSGFPGMRVFQFAFVGDPNSPHLPHNYPENCVAYTGTHDNNTLLGYLWELDDGTRREMLNYCGHVGDWRDGLDAMLRTLLESRAGLVILPVQDLLGHGADTRMNTPGKAEGNWRYRVTAEQLDAIDWGKFRGLNRLCGRDG
ncbi:MAG: 4-alpha-glucanotransferase [Clostridia bacterium]|nr:4-alpha-glucanotransferase [Clostridia bacterium]